MTKVRPRTTSRKQKRKGTGPRRRRRSASSRKRGRRQTARRLISRVAAVLALAMLAYTVYLDVTVRQRFEGQRWPIPAHVYTRPLELYEGRHLTRERLVRELTELGYRRVDRAEHAGTYAVGGRGVDVVVRPFVFWDGLRPATSFTLSFRDGRVAALSGAGAANGIVRLEPRLFGSISPIHHEDRDLVRLDQVPPHLINALLAVEDRNFYDHMGLDPRGLARALWVNVTSGRVVQGGSTLTQQLVKNFYLSKERTFRRKLTEMVMAALLELHYEKDEILEAYLNEVYLGQTGNRAIHGFGLGSLFYFGRPLHELQLPEAALLAGMVKGPSHYNPLRFPQRARERRDLVLRRMAELGFIDAQAARRATESGLGLSQQSAPAARAYPAYADFVRRQLRRDYRENDLRSEGLRIFTNLDPDIQRSVERAVRARATSIERARELPRGTLEVAAVVTRRDSGEVVALVGGREPRFAGFNRALEARRPVGSLIKPAVYLAALQRPARFTLASLLEDSPLRVTQAGSPDWEPNNYDRQYRGRVLLLRSLADSYNASTARLGMAVGVDKVAALLRKLGIRRKFAAYPSLLLGAVDLTPLEVAQMYATLASGGFRVPLRSIRSVLSRDEQPLARYPLAIEQVIEPGPMALLDFGLQEVVRSGTARALRQRFPDDLRVAGKTGTTDDFRDSWFAGYAGDHLAVVWLGRDDNKPVGLSGASGAMSVWADIVAQLEFEPRDPLLPEDVELVAVDPASGRVADEFCESRLDMPFIKGSAPTERAPCAAPRVVTKARGKLRNWFKRWFLRP